MLQGERYQGRPIYYSDVIVRAECAARQFLDLRGCRWAYNERDSHSGYNITRYTLVRLGETRGFFGRVVEAGYHQTAIRMVVDGQVDAAAIDSQVLAVELRDHPSWARRSASSRRWVRRRSSRWNCVARAHPDQGRVACGALRAGG